MIIKNTPIKPGTALKVAYGAASVQSAAVGATTIMLVATTAVHVVIGQNPTATTNDTLIPANTPVWFECAKTDLVAAIQDSAGGSLYITPGL
jgi:hypothetical protein